MYDQVCDELRRGKKYGHWMWFIFPQIQGLGLSPLEAMSDLRHLSHSLLVGVFAIEDKTPNQILGFPDDLKLKSCMTLFERAKPFSVFFRGAGIATVGNGALERSAHPLGAGRR